ncbi:hypothetical protein GCM10022262_24980 [Georgenia daeguensis]|uniref:Uncharacterized protein n=1 Tax=Georgenia daeguensis TaxID=908355 RepID=A0ABP8EVY8_9MICO
MLRGSGASGAAVPAGAGDAGRRTANVAASVAVQASTAAQRREDRGHGGRAKSRCADNRCAENMASELLGTRTPV